MPTINVAATGANITKMRKDAGLTVKDLQNIFGFGTPQAIYKWQNGTTLPTVDNLVVLAAVFGCKIDDILVVDKDVVRKTA
ncbi:helix-turn-helix domain-containing protein [Lacrimispora sp. 210928-DFI.3.58]|uniref:helix-turn-helix domain-containing protein n=1 Tax=Lacrimispora sp. 210928-DFI.3.58 TaxID=2883214 RepID=UPI001D06DB98|nr:helix-turn-helix transcriptional regulator [Lacrimispora sp. 210928-DFI.3.58]MCB7319917.1 helix-turn-helix domain-containing protein [Lacrimispora sp. 210928-DFI.3.58]